MCTAVNKDSTDAQHVAAATLYWLEKTVIGLNLCPFAKKELAEHRIKVQVCAALKIDDVLLSLQQEITRLDTDASVTTTLLVLSQALPDFYDFNDFIALGEQLINTMDRSGVYQLASFHPEYRFSGTEPNDPENFTNRSPYPVLHILREESVSAAVDAHPNTHAIPERNIALMNSMGFAKMHAMLTTAKQHQDTS